MNAPLAQKTLRYVQVASELTKRAIDGHKILSDDRQKAASGQDQLITDMIGAEAIGDNQKEKVAELLGTHAGTATLLKSAVARIAALSKNQKQAGDDLGGGVDPSVLDDPAKSADDANDNYVGYRGSEKKASDHAMLAILDAPGT
jgi:hypothetical protein